MLRKPAADALDLFDDAVEALRAGVGDLLGERDGDGRPPGLDGGGEASGLRHVGAGRRHRTATAMPDLVGVALQAGELAGGEPVSRSEQHAPLRPHRISLDPAATVAFTGDAFSAYMPPDLSRCRTTSGRTWV